MMQPLSILHLEASPGWGGQEIRILREACGLRNRGYCIFFAIMRGGVLAQRARQEGFEVFELNFHKQGWPVTLFQLIRIIRSRSISLVNTHSSLDSWIGGIAARLCRVPIVRTRHLSTLNRAGLNSRLLYGTLADYVVTTCSGVLHSISERSKKPLSKMSSVPTGIDPAQMQIDERKTSLFRERLAVSERDFLVGTACFMRSWKGLDDLLGAASLLRNEPNVRWVIIGGGHEEGYRKKAADLGLESILHFTGHLENPIDAIAGLDAFALLSTAHEGVSQAILQAAYLKKPLIATSTGGLCEVCLDGETGIQVPSFSKERVAKAVCRLKDNPDMREKFGLKGKELVEQKFTLDQMLNEMETIFQHVVQKVATK